MPGTAAGARQAEGLRAMDTATARLRLEAERDRLLGVLAAAGSLGAGAPRGGMAFTPTSCPPSRPTRPWSASWTRRSRCGSGPSSSEVEAALNRLDVGTYGRCEICGSEIAADRLEAMPAARLCLADQARAGRDPRARFGH